jgi:hypothetical protein
VRAEALRLVVTRRVTRRPLTPRTQRWGWGLGYSLVFEPFDPDLATQGQGAEAVLAWFPFGRLRSPVEEPGVRELRSNLSLDLGAGVGQLGRSAGEGGFVNEAGAIVSLGVGYRLSGRFGLGVGVSRLDFLSTDGYYLRATYAFR